METGSLISMRGLRVAYEKTEVLKGIDLDIRKGEMLALLGASGCGKTTLLRALAGFMPAAGGSVHLRGKDVLPLPPEARGMAMVFQSYALWPHMNVAQNIAYGLRLRGMPAAEISRRVEDTLGMLGLSGYGTRRISQLSGGQRQRVALGRALAIGPEILLLDEPLSNLDAGIRQQMRHEIRSLQKKLGLTAILVTHDREEALAMADRIVILNAGCIEQVGTPEEVFGAPKTPYVASFMGAGNRIGCRARRSADVLCLEAEGNAVAGQMLLQVAPEILPQCSGEEPVQVYFRSEAASLHVSHQLPENSLRLAGRVGSTSFLGSVYRCEVNTDCGSFLVDHPVRLNFDQEVLMCVPAAMLHVFARPHASAAN
jgi:putative spermidine/putrescine transport system ATP-binding protein